MTMLQDGSFVPANEYYVAFEVISATKIKKRYVDIEKMKKDENYIVAICECCKDYYFAEIGTENANVIYNKTDGTGSFICYICEEQYNYVVCEDCNTWTQNPSYIQDDEKYICEDCLNNNNYAICEDCLDIFNKDNMKFVENHGYVCDGCCDEGDYHTCEYCGDIFRETDMVLTADGRNWYCNSCANETLHWCDNCGACFEDSDNVEYNSYENSYLCENCYNHCDNAINDYSFKPTPTFFKAYDELPTDEYFGFEIEVDGDQDYADAFLDEFGGTDLIYLKNDSSVDGFEIVTHPMTRKFINTTFKSRLEYGMRFLRENYFKGHNHGGIHIHVSRSAISDNQLVKMLQLLTFDPDKKYSEKKYKKWLAITQREKKRMHEWSKMEADIYLKRYDTYINDFDINLKSPARGAKYIKETILNGLPLNNYHDDRYRCINLENENTYEFRIFNSNLRVERIMKDAQVIFSLIDFTATDELPTMRNYLNFVIRNKETYPEYADFLIEKEIIPKQETIDKQKTFIDGVKQMLNDNEIRTLADIQNYINNLTLELQPDEETEGETICA